jgi:hypothetical protein
MPDLPGRKCLPDKESQEALNNPKNRRENRNLAYGFGYNGVSAYHDVMRHCVAWSGPVSPEDHGLVRHGSSLTGRAIAA